MNNRCCCNGRNSQDEIAVILEKIAKLQREAVREELADKFCDADFLGEIATFGKFNTRPIQVFTNEDRAWGCPINREDGDCVLENMEKSCVFRVERVVNGAVVLRALKEKHEHEHNDMDDNCPRERFEATNSFITIEICRLAALRCLRDTFVNLCIF